jgi:zinc D-Ala-D-Ala carboxypeptidase
MNLSENFTLQELIYSDTAVRMGIDNKPNDETVENLKILCENILEPIRSHFKAPVVVSSGYRSEAVCLAVGSSSKSQHIKGQAVDFEIFGIPNKDVTDWIVQNLDYDQCILEFWNDKEPNSGWVHCSYSKDNNRKQYLNAQKLNGRVVYTVMECKN